MITPTPIGKISSDLLKKTDPEVPVIEQGREMTKGYMDNVLDTLAAGKRIYPGDFFVVVISKQEVLMKNVIRNYFLHRWSCPMPEYNQAVFMYNKKDDGLEFLWVLPNKNTCKNLAKNAALVPPDKWDLLQYVLRFRDHSLMNLSKDINEKLKLRVEDV